MLGEWLRALSAELGIDADIDEIAVLDLTRDIAHNVARPAAPLTAFLVGLAAGREGGSVDDVTRAVGVAAELARGWSASDPG